RDKIKADNPLLPVPTHPQCFFFSSRRRHTRWPRDWSSDVCSSDLLNMISESLAQIMFKFTNYVMLFAPIGVGAAMAHTIGTQGRSEERRVGKECRGGGGRQR